MKRVTHPGSTNVGVAIVFRRDRFAMVYLNCVDGNDEINCGRTVFWLFVCGDVGSKI